MINLMQRAMMTVGKRALAWQLQREKDSVLSVILVTRNKASYLNLTMYALALQKIPAHSWELIVIDNASQDITPDVLARHEMIGALPLVHYREEDVACRAALLNQAIQSAKGHRIVFMHDDRLVTSEFLMQHLLAQQADYPGNIILGDDHLCAHTHLFTPEEPHHCGIPAPPMIDAGILCDPKLLARQTFSNDRDYGSMFSYFAQRGASPPFPWAFFTTANASVSRDALLHVGGFDERFTGWGVEDTDLAFRLNQAHLPFRYSYQALTIRQLRPSWPGEPRALRQNVNRFLGKYPQLTHTERAIVGRTNYIFVD